jgi:hypothetical protein
MTTSKLATSRCDQLLQIRAPAYLKRAIERAAGIRLLSRSDYVRGALLEKLQADRIDVNRLNHGSPPDKGERS